MTPEEIYTEIHQEVVGDVSIGATSTSKLAEFRKLIYNITSMSLILQGLWEIFRKILQSTADAVPTCNAAWWDREIRKFQYGHTLLLDGLSKQYYYETADPDSQIVSRVAIIDQARKGLIKVAKDGPVALSADERAALSSYIKKRQPLGSNIVLISQAGDVIKIVLDVHYDPIIPKATVQANVEAAVNVYLASLDFNVGKSGTFYITYMIDVIQAVEGVVDVTATEVAASQFGAPELATIARKYVPVAGYVSIHPDHQLADTITYTPEA